MKRAPHESGRPLFILGTGRCGATFWQTLLCRDPDTLIWREHGGLLLPLLRSRDRLHRVGDLLDLGRDVTPFDADDRLVETNGTKLAWMNGITLDDYDDLLRGFIDAYMRHGLPTGRSTWASRRCGTAEPTSRRPATCGGCFRAAM
ncbi:MAG: hypothetical protein FJ284_06260 [Planctomycetes bacterium]|nr:hypothetical protein [Planctomycetota bacterium]